MFLSMCMNIYFSVCCMLCESKKTQIIFSSFIIYIIILCLNEIFRFYEKYINYLQWLFLFGLAVLYEHFERISVPSTFLKLLQIILQGDLCHLLKIMSFDTYESTAWTLFEAKINLIFLLLHRISLLLELGLRWWKSSVLASTGPYSTRIDFVTNFFHQNFSLNRHNQER